VRTSGIRDSRHASRCARCRPSRGPAG
jgi:hypothetical protein